MGCCDADSVQVSKMALELKSGPMLWYKRRFFGSNWRDVHSVLYNDSSLLWYRDKSRQEQEGGVVLKDAPELIAFGPYTSAVPDRPSLPDNYEIKELLAFGVRGKDIVYWFLCPNEEEVASWMAAIASSIPRPPVPPQHVQATAPNYPSQPPQQQMLSTPLPPQQQMSSTQLPPQYTPRQQAPPYAPQPPPVPGQYPAPMSYRPPVQAGYNSVHPQPYSNAGGGGTTVVVQDRGGYAPGGGDFAMGMLLGGALGTAWGSHHYGMGWGGGWGGHGPVVHDTNVHINNYYDNDTSVVNNNVDLTNNVDIEQGIPGGGEVIAGDMMPLEDGRNDYIGGDLVPIEDSGGGMFDGGGMLDGDDFGDFGGGDFGDF